MRAKLGAGKLSFPVSLISNNMILLFVYTAKRALWAHTKCTISWVGMANSCAFKIAKDGNCSNIIRVPRCKTAISRERESWLELVHCTILMLWMSSWDELNAELNAARDACRLESFISYKKSLESALASTYSSVPYTLLQGARFDAVETANTHTHTHLDAMKKTYPEHVTLSKDETVRKCRYAWRLGWRRHHTNYRQWRHETDYVRMTQRYVWWLHSTILLCTDLIIWDNWWDSWSATRSACALGWWRPRPTGELLASMDNGLWAGQSRSDAGIHTMVCVGMCIEIDRLNSGRWAGEPSPCYPAFELPAVVRNMFFGFIFDWKLGCASGT